MESTDKTYASSGVANTGLGLSIGALGLMLLQNGALGGILGGNRPDPSNPPWARDMTYERELTKANAEIGQLKAEQYANAAVLAAERRLADKIEKVETAMNQAAATQAVLNAKQEAFIGGLAAQVASFDKMTARYIAGPVMVASEAVMSAAKPAAATTTNG